MFPEVAKTQEAKHLINFFQAMGPVSSFTDLHETPQADVTIWRPFAEKYKGRKLSDEERTSVPQGAFVIVEKRDGDLENSAQLAFGRAVVNAMAQYSPIAPEPEVLDKANDNGLTQGGPLDGSTRTFMTALGTHHVVVTELNPDMYGMSHQKSVLTQIAAIEAALSF